MFRNILGRMFGDDPQSDPLDSSDAEVAIAALMVRLARADDHYGEVERNRIDQIIARRRGLTTPEAAERREAAELIESEAPDTVRFTRQIKDRVALEDRIGVVTALWETAYADGARSAAEETLVRLVAGLLGISDRDSALARKKVLVDLGIADD